MGGEGEGGRGGSPTLSANPYYLLNTAAPFHEGMRLENVVQSK